MLECIDELTIDSEFDFRAALKSLEFYWRLAQSRGEPIHFEIWAELGAVVPPITPDFIVRRKERA